MTVRKSIRTCILRLMIYLKGHSREPEGRTRLYGVPMPTLTGWRPWAQIFSEYPFSTVFLMMARYGPQQSKKSNTARPRAHSSEIYNRHQRGRGYFIRFAIKEKIAAPSRLDSDEITEEQNVSVLALACPQIETNEVLGLIGCKCLWNPLRTVPLPEYMGKTIA